MLFITIRPFILSLVFAKLVLLDQIARDEQFESIVYRSAAYIDRFIDKISIQLLSLEMVSAGVNLFEYGVSFYGFPLAFLLQIGGKDIVYLFVCLFV